MDTSRLIRLSLETLFLFGALFLVDHGLLKGAAFDGIQPSPYWIPVLIMALAYGTGPGLVAAGIATGLWLAAPHDTAAVGDALQVALYLSLQPLLWVVVAAVIGEVTDSRRSTMDGLQQFSRETAEKEQIIAEALTRLATTNRALQVRIATGELSVGQAIEEAVGLLERDRRSQVSAVERLAALALETEDFTYFEVDGERTIPRFRGGATNDRLADMSGADGVQIGAGRALPLVADSQPDPQALADSGEVTVPARIRGVQVGMLVIRNLPPPVQLETRAAEHSHVAETLATIAALLPREKTAVVRPRWRRSKDKVA